MAEKEIIICEKPDSVSWEQISKVLVNAHKPNLEKGIFMRYPFLPPEEIRARIEGRGVMLVAMDGDKPVGTGAVLFLDKNFWYGSGKFAYCCFASILPEYSGRGLYRRMLETEDSLALSKGYERLYFDTNEKNERVINVSRKAGYQFVDYKIRADHNSIKMVKWLKKQPLPGFAYSVIFQIIRLYRRLRKRFS